MSYTVIAFHPEGFRLIVEFAKPGNALRAYEAAGKKALQTASMKVQLLDGDCQISEFCGP